MKSRSRMVSGLLALAFVAGCASTEVADQKILVTEKLPRPNRILVYNFAATPADAPELASQTAGSPPQTAQEIQAGRQLGAHIAGLLAAEIRDMGLPGAEVPIGTPARLNDIIIKGYLLSVQEGSATKRMALGFGAGASELQTAVEGFQMTSQGPRKLGTRRGGGSRRPHRDR